MAVLITEIWVTSVSQISFTPLFMTISRSPTGGMSSLYKCVFYHPHTFVLHVYCSVQIHIPNGHAIDLLAFC